jgi:hypothetical protein
MNLSFCRMYVHWREREHEDIDALVLEYPASLVVLAQCGLLKFFKCPLMRAQPRMLNALVDYWHPESEAFILEVSINKISNLSLKVIVLLIGRITGSVTLHQASQVHMHYGSTW